LTDRNDYPENTINSIRVFVQHPDDEQRVIQFSLFMGSQWRGLLGFELQERSTIELTVDFEILFVQFLQFYESASTKVLQRPNLTL